MDPMTPDPATLAAEAGLLRVYLRVLDFVLQRARAGDASAHGFQRALTLGYLPAPAESQVRQWLVNASGRTTLGNRSSDPYVARQLLLDMAAAERNAPALAPAAWAQAVATVRANAGA
ncbi:MAG: hypothetical protein U0869_10330 [Chloroflexota bacterium]